MSGFERFVDITENITHDVSVQIWDVKFFMGELNVVFRLNNWDKRK